MINNYQREAGEEDDRDSGSLTVISPLAQGDQACVLAGNSKLGNDDIEKN